MTFTRIALLGWTLAVLLVAGFAIYGRQQYTVARSFCAYGKVFVEFDEGGKKWGTLMLNWDGKPIPCKEDDDEVVTNTTRYTI